MGDKRHKQQKRRDAQRDENGKSLYEKVMAGEIEPKGSQKGWKNLKPIPITQVEPEKRREMCIKGAQAVNKIRGEEKTAKESLDRMLSLLATPEILEAADIESALVERMRRDNPNMTVYDAMNAAALGRALAGNIKAAEYVRDTRGDKPQDRVQIDGVNVMTDSDRAMLEKISSRLNDPAVIVATQPGDQDE